MYADEMCVGSFIVWVCRVTPNAFKCGRIIKLSDYQVPPAPPPPHSPNTEL